MTFDIAFANDVATRVVDAAVSLDHWSEDDHAERFLMGPAELRNIVVMALRDYHDSMSTPAPSYPTSATCTRQLSETALLGPVVWRWSSSNLHTCPDCRNRFVQPFVCITCGAEKLYDETVRSQAATIEHLRGYERAWRKFVSTQSGDAEEAYRCEHGVMPLDRCEDCEGQ